MKSILAVLLALMAFTAVMAQDKQEVQAVLQLLADMKRGASDELTALEESWAQRAQNKQSVIDAVSVSAQEQRAECNAKDQEVQGKLRDIDITNKYIAWMQKRQEHNNARIETLDDNNCQRTNNYVNDIKNDKVALALIQFLKRELRGASDNEFSLIQKKSWAKRVNKFMDLYREGRLYSMVQVNAEQDFYFGEEEEPVETLLVLENDADIVLEDEDGRQVPVTYEHGRFEIDGDDIAISLSDGDIDPSISPRTGRSAGSARPQSSYEERDELIELLDEFEIHIREHLEQSQLQQVNSAFTFIDFRNAIERENETYDRHIKEEQDNVVRLTNQLVNRNQASNLCKARLQQITVALQVSEEDLSNSKSNFEELRNAKLEELKTFEEVYRIYVNQVSSV